MLHESCPVLPLRLVASCTAAGRQRKKEREGIVKERERAAAAATAMATQRRSQGKESAY